MDNLETLKQQLQQQQKLASLGMLSAGIAHEIQNPLNFVINFSKMSDKLLNDLTEIIDDNADKFSPEDQEEVADIMADLKENLAKTQQGRCASHWGVHRRMLRDSKPYSKSQC